ncbi:Biotin carboxylase [Limihaloglobus sulfuriphilus]|uniref:Biotin carboxylase n=1 Tax=Limihaloglobus sulfuriphilus TaxID=1851148 RepID=A0A1Q2MH57_9BACT|nr:acetyl-CoA carboxylase biotin carboxylase subunit [Limihaloglobus sulfuriphilus]AQQ71984.1 Biotin carboxylase [Limihaloglobus sulfuriphilus]
MFSKILIANRGEVALRIIRACHEMGIEAVVVYSTADKDSNYVRFADKAICIGPASPAQSYLNINAIISAAEIADVDAIHPGYGFLAENAHFAEVCRECNIAFIGPSPEAMTKLGDKAKARDMAVDAKVPVVPGSPGPLSDEESGRKLAREIGFPVMIKASAGGGGRGMRLVHNDISFRNAYQSAKAEAMGAFGNDEVYLEKFIENPRHVEVQVMSDKYGNVLHFYERDCSIQRRHQKLIEEAPCPVLDEETREKLCEAAKRLMKNAKYENAATVEFLLDKDRNFYFIEANTRIQVEHPVSELVTGHDLIKMQIRVAAGEELKLKQKDIKLNGCAIECRINAENPDMNFSPSPGPVDEFFVPGGFGVRVETFIKQGSYISPNYDSMIAKLLVHNNTRQEAIATMKRALNEFKIGPIKSTIPASLKILNDSDYVNNNVDTGYVERKIYPPKS